MRCCCALIGRFLSSTSALGNFQWSHPTSTSQHHIRKFFLLSPKLSRVSVVSRQIRFSFLHSRLPQFTHEQARCSIAMNQHNDGLQLQKRSESDVCTYDDSDMRRMGKRQELRVCAVPYHTRLSLLISIESLSLCIFSWLRYLCDGYLGDSLGVHMFCPPHPQALRSSYRSNTQSLISGGLAGLFWSLCWVYIGQLFVILSLAEMSSMWVVCTPTFEY